MYDTFALQQFYYSFPSPVFRGVSGSAGRVTWSLEALNALYSHKAAKQWTLQEAYVLLIGNYIPKTFWYMSASAWNSENPSSRLPCVLLAFGLHVWPSRYRSSWWRAELSWSFLIAASFGACYWGPSVIAAARPVASRAPKFNLQSGLFVGSIFAFMDAAPSFVLSAQDFC